MDKRKAEQRKRVARKVGDLSAAPVGRAAAAAVIGGEAKKPAPAPKPAYLQLTLENTMISNYS